MNTIITNPNLNLRVETQQKSDFKSDINERLSMINDTSIQNRRRLPFNNNIRDYQITVDSKRDAFNERISNFTSKWKYGSTCRT